MRNTGHMKKFVDQGTERGATETELPALSIKTDTTEEGVTFEQDPIGGIQKNSQTQTVPSFAEYSSRTAAESSSQEKRNPQWMKDFVCK